jgi:hypothetical protein
VQDSTKVEEEKKEEEEGTKEEEKEEEAKACGRGVSNEQKQLEASGAAATPIEQTQERYMDMDPQELHIFEYAQLKEATDNFNQVPVAAGGRLLGAGGFGAVYQGMLKHLGRFSLVPVAVKTLDQDEEVGAASGITAAEQFAAEVQILSDLHHENLVMLLGFSMDGDRRCLVYSLMQHGALGEARNSVLLCSDMSFCADDRLACLDQSPPLSAARRVRIAADIVFGLVRIYC